MDPKQSKTLGRPVRSIDPQPSLFEVEPTWSDHWWGMPSFDMGDATPSRTISVNFMTREDAEDFARKLGVKVADRTDSLWYPPQKHLSGEFEYDGPKTSSRYPVCIPSKGRWSTQKTGKALDRMGVDFKFFVEQTEYESYATHLGEGRVVSMPFHNLGQGSIPARNFIWDWAKERGYNRHWTVDDNITSFARCTNNRRLCVRGGGLFRAMEDFVDRYENVAMAGPHHKGFVPDRGADLSPFLVNSRVYSCILLDTNLDMRWRGKYNEDTDLSLRILKSGLCTLLFRALLMDKAGTSKGGASSGNALRGGNTDNVYNSEDYRLAFARSLEEQHPDCVQVVWKFGRYHHQVDYSSFRKNELKLKDRVVKTMDSNEYGMELVRLPKMELDQSESE